MMQVAQSVLAEQFAGISELGRIVQAVYPEALAPVPAPRPVETAPVSDSTEAPSYQLLARQSIEAETTAPTDAGKIDLQSPVSLDSLRAYVDEVHDEAA